MKKFVLLVFTTIFAATSSYANHHGDDNYTSGNNDNSFYKEYHEGYGQAKQETQNQNVNIIYKIKKGKEGQKTKHPKRKNHHKGKNHQKMDRHMKRKLDKLPADKKETKNQVEEKVTVSSLPEIKKAQPNVKTRIEKPINKESTIDKESNNIDDKRRIGRLRKLA